MELESAGNVRLEEGRPEDAWYQSLEAMLQQRLGCGGGGGGGPWGVAGLRLVAALRVHNRGLRAQFEAGAAGDYVGAGGGAAAAAAAHVEHLFYGEHPVLPGEGAAGGGRCWVGARWWEGLSCKTPHTRCTF